VHSNKTFGVSPREKPVGEESGNEATEDGDKSRLNCWRGKRTSRQCHVYKRITHSAMCQ